MPNGAILGPVVENLLTPSLLYHIIEGRYVTLQTEGGWARVRLVWDKQYETHKIRKRKTIFAESSSLVFIEPILDVIQPFENSKCKRNV